MSRGALLDTVNTPADVRRLTPAELPILCEQIREFLIERVPKTGGHLASNLGAVELTVAMHRVFDCPKDHIIFDVGHQAYVHKMLTERKHLFADLRKPGGLSGFTCRKESPYDAFGAGHSSTSISAALGFAHADRLRQSDAYTVCVVGDGAYTGGMIHEALNNCDSELPLIILLNENGMSISMNRGTFASYLSRVRLSARYRGFKSRVKTSVRASSFVGHLLRSLHGRIKRLVYKQNHFEDLGLYYIGPIDGNNVAEVEAALRKARSLGRATVVHLRTQKGKGYFPAEDAPDVFHSVRCGERPHSSFHEQFGEELMSLAAEDADIVAVTAAMGLGTGLAAFGEAYPARYFDVGIAEEHALTFSAGLAAAGLKPFVAIYSTFLQRAYDNILHDVALQGLPVRMVIDRAGLAVADGPTHHGIFDVAFLSHIPGVRVLAPVTYGALRAATREMAAAEGPVAVRYADACEDARVAEVFPYEAGRPLGVRTSFAADAVPARLIVTYGGEVARALEAADTVRAHGLSVGVVLLERLTPVADVAKELAPIVSRASHVIFAEEGIREGGAAVLLTERLYAMDAFARGACVETVAIEDFAAPSGLCDLFEHVGLSAHALAQRLLDRR